MAEGMAVLVREIAFGGCAHVREDERGSGFGGEAREVEAVPGGDGRGEDGGRGAEEGGRVVPDAETVAVVGAARVLCVVCVGELLWMSGQKRVGGKGGTYETEAGVV